VLTSQNARNYLCVSFGIIVSFALVFFGATSLRAQVAGGSLSGIVTDASGAVVANAQIAAKNVANGVIANSMANGSGLYTLSNLLPATYDITVSAQGFSTLVQTGVTLTVGAQQELNFSLRVGSLSTQVEVTTEVPAMQLTSSELSGTVESAAIVELPLNGRDWASLATLQPGVVSVRTQEVVSQPGGSARGLGMQMSIDGNRPVQNVYRLNGIIVNDYSNAGPGNVLGANLGVDAIQEFSVITSNYSAQYGFTSGGVINAINKSGTNSFHGSAYEFLRNSALDANDFFANAASLPRPEFRRNQFGGSAGGPILKNKIWIFGDYEGLRQSKGIPTIGRSPSQAARDGIINDSTGAPIGPPVTASQCLAQNPNSVVPIPGQTDVCVDTNTLAFINAFFQVPTTLAGPSNNTGSFTFIGQNVVTENYGTERVDFHLSDHDTLNSSYYYDHSIWSTPDPLNDQLNGFVIDRWALSAEETHVFSSALVNSVRFGFNNSGMTNPSLVALNPHMTDTTFGMTSSLVSPGISSVAAGSGVAGISKFSAFQPSGSEDMATHMYEVFDDAVYTVGRHTIRIGGDFLRDTVDFNLTGQLNGSVSFPNLTDFIENIPGKTQGPTAAPFVEGVTPHTTNAYIIGGYIQDDWKVRPRLTLNLGLRYEFETIPVEVNGKTANLPLLTTNPGNCVANADGTPNKTACAGFNFSVFTSNPTKRNFDPRIGFAYDVFGDGKTAVRGGFGIFDVLPLPFMTVLNNAQTSPFQAKAVITPQPYSFPRGIGAELLAGGGSVPPPSSTTWNYIEPNPKRNYVMQYNLNIQRQLTPGTSLTVAYAGSRGIHNPFVADELNTVWPFVTPGVGGGYLFPTVTGTAGQVTCAGPGIPAGSCGTAIANPTGYVRGNIINANVGGIQSTIFEAQSWYNSLQVEVEKRMSHGFQIQGSFTWAKSLDTSSSSFAGDNYASDVTPTIPWWDLRITKGPSDFNVGKNLVINGLWNIPTPASFSGPAAFIAKGWGLGGVFSASTGPPIWPLDGLEADPMGQLNLEPLAIPSLAPGCTPRNVVNPGQVQYLNASCFINAQAPSQAFYDAPSPMGCSHAFAFPTCINLLGTLGRNVITGPGLINVDASIVKDTHISKISESFDVQFRAEFFNIANHVNFAPPVNNLEALDATGAPVGGFGQITGLQVPAREIQFGLKLIW
jgi:Carboxypeptidase regulatory-like domain